MTPHTKVQGLEAMQNLIAHTCLVEADFYSSDDFDKDLGLEPGTPMVRTNDDSLISAFDHWNDWQLSTDTDMEHAEYEWYIKQEKFNQKHPNIAK